MANGRARASANFTDDLFELMDSVPSKKKGKHIGFREIRFKNGRCEFDYTVSQGKFTNEGTLLIRFSSEDELGKIAMKLAETLGDLYVELERGS